MPPRNFEFRLDKRVESSSITAITRFNFILVKQVKKGPEVTYSTNARFVEKNAFTSEDTCEQRPQKFG
jgi:hypothetical protein